MTKQRNSPDCASSELSGRLAGESIDTTVSSGAMRAIAAMEQRTRMKKPKPSVILDGPDANSKIIVLANGLHTIVDACCAQWLGQWSWRLGSGYVLRNTNVDGKRQTILMHRQILGLTDPKQQGEHWDTNPLNNRRGNLRVATQSQNNANQRRVTNNSGYKGVYHKKTKQLNPYMASIKTGRKSRFLGWRATAEEAAKLYDQAAKELFGEFARLNFPIA